MQQTNLIDQATNIRQGEELDIPSLQKYLLANLEEVSGELTIEQFPGGASNLTYLLKLGEQQMVLRRPPFGANVKSAHDMSREYKVLSALSKSYKKAPKPLIYTNNESIIGAEFYVMERVQGVILRGDGGPAKKMEETEIFKIADSLMDTMVELHALDYEKIGLSNLGKPEGYVTRQVEGWTRRYFKAQTDEMPVIEQAARWLNNNIPKETGASLIHNDFKHDNVVLAASDLTKIVAILDWEMSTIGDPLMDLGTTMAYWMNHDDPSIMRNAFPNPSILKGNPSREGMLQLYAEKSGRDVGDFVFYYAYGLFKLAVVLQQIYYRYHKGFTKDKRFAYMNKMAETLCQIAVRAIEKKRIDDLF
ncbi:MAG: phosphotransferase family protein [Chitinophagales bacterium]